MRERVILKAIWLRRKVRPHPIGVVRVALGIRQADEAKACGSIERDQLRQHPRFEGAFVQQNDIRNVASVQLVRKPAIEADRLSRRRQIHVLQARDCRLIIGRGAARKRPRPLPVTEIHRHVSDLVATPGEYLTSGGTLRGILSLVEERIAEPVPVGPAGELLQHRLVTGDLPLELGDAHFIQMLVRPGVIAQREPRCAPRLQRIDRLRTVLDPVRIHEPIGRHMGPGQRTDDAIGYTLRRIARRHRTMDRKIVKGQRDLRRMGDLRLRSRTTRQQQCGERNSCEPQCFFSDWASHAETHTSGAFQLIATSLMLNASASSAQQVWGAHCPFIRSAT